MYVSGHVGVSEQRLGSRPGGDDIGGDRSSSPRPSQQPSGRRRTGPCRSLTRSDKHIGSDSKHCLPACLSTCIPPSESESKASASRPSGVPKSQEASVCAGRWVGDGREMCPRCRGARGAWGGGGKTRRACACSGWPDGQSPLQVSQGGVICAACRHCCPRFKRLPSFLPPPLARLASSAMPAGCPRRRPLRGGAGRGGPHFAKGRGRWR